MRAVFTVAQNHRLPNAKILQQSLKKSNPELDFVLCLVDERVDSQLVFDKTMMINELQLADFNKMQGQYSTQELLASTKPYFAKKLLETYSEVFFFDVTSEIMGNLAPKFDLLKENNVVLVPQILKARQFHDEKQILNSGMFTATCFGLKRSEETNKMLTWWQSKMIDKAFIEPEKGFWLDQIWLNHVPIFFKNVHIDKSGQLSAGLWVKTEADNVLSVCYARASTLPNSYLNQLKSLDYKSFKDLQPKFGYTIPTKSPLRVVLANGIRAVGNGLEKAVSKVADLLYG
jgi:hypothetical protein